MKTIKKTQFDDIGNLLGIMAVVVFTIVADENLPDTTQVQNVHSLGRV